MAGRGTDRGSVLARRALDVRDAGLGLRLYRRAAVRCIRLREPRFARLALGLGGGGTRHGCVMARRAFVVLKATVRARAHCRADVQTNRRQIHETIGSRINDL